MADDIDRDVNLSTSGQSSTEGEHRHNNSPPWPARSFLLHMGMTALMVMAMVACVIVTLKRHSDLTVQRIDQNATSYLIYVEETLNKMRAELSDDLAINSMNLSHNFRTQVASFHHAFSTALDAVSHQSQTQTSQILTVTNRLNQNLKILSGLQLRIQTKIAKMLSLLQKNMTYERKMLANDMEQKTQLLLKIWTSANETQRETTRAEVAGAGALNSLFDVVKEIPKNLTANISSLTARQMDLSGLLANAADGITTIGRSVEENHATFVSFGTSVNEKVRDAAASLFSHNEAKNFDPTLKQALNSMSAEICESLSYMLSSLYNSRCHQSTTFSMDCP